MSLKETITNDIKEAMKAKDKVVLSTLRMVKARFIEEETAAKAKEVDDEKAIAILQNMIKQRQESAKTYSENDRQEMADNESAEVEVLKKYLPEGISEDLVKSTVAEVVEATGASGPQDMGKVMGQVMGKLKATGGLVDGAVVQKLVKEKLL
jgi:uncharacterized protein YqeY